LECSPVSVAEETVSGATCYLKTSQLQIHRSKPGYYYTVSESSYTNNKL